MCVFLSPHPAQLVEALCFCFCPSVCALNTIFHKPVDGMSSNSQLWTKTNNGVDFEVTARPNMVNNLGTFSHNKTLNDDTLN